MAHKTIRKLPDDLTPGGYSFRVAMLDPRTELPAIQLAIQGREPDGWYRLGSIRVEQGMPYPARGRQGA